MGLDDLDWQVVCCSDHVTATVRVDETRSINIQKVEAGYSMTVADRGLFVRACHGMTHAAAEAALADAMVGR